MDPKLQSSFIPKSPVVPDGVGMPAMRKAGHKSFFTFIALIIFMFSLVLALGMFGYKFYLKYRIGQMGADLEKAQATVQPEVIRELVDLDNRIISTKNLVSRHIALTPLFEFLEISTPKTVRFSDFRYTATESGGLTLSMKGEARGYAALALAADIFSKSPYFKNPTFSNLNLNAKGDVGFSFEGVADQSLVSYNKVIEQLDVPVISTTSPSQATTTSASTSSPQAN